MVSKWEMRGDTAFDIKCDIVHSIIIHRHREQFYEELQATGAVTVTQISSVSSRNADIFYHGILSFRKTLVKHVMPLSQAGIKVAYSMSSVEVSTMEIIRIRCSSVGGTASMSRISLLLFSLHSVPC